MIEKTFLAIKPDGVERGLIGKIISRFEDAGLRIIAMKMVWLDKKFARKHYQEHVKKGFYKGLESFIVQGPVVAFVVEGVHSVEICRKIVGSTQPFEAAPGTIRGDFASHSNKWADKKRIGVKNLIHASANAKDAKREINLWFSKKDLHGYKNVHEKHSR